MQSAVSTLFLLLVALLVLVLPGAAVRIWVAPRGEDGLEWLADAVGLSIALSALVALGAFLLQLSMGWGALWLLYGLAGIGLLAGLAHAWRRGWLRSSWVSAAVVVLGLAAFGGLVAWRLVQSSGLALPAWVDSVHHVLIVAKIQAAGGIPETLRPEVPVLFSYHYAFHLVAALLSSASGHEPAAAVLLYGQVINALVSLSTYRLGKAIFRDPARAGLAALLIGFSFTMPAYYVTWGRYTLLTGLVMMPLAMAAVLDDERVPSWGGRLLLALLTAGLALSHYTTLWLFVLFLALWGGLMALRVLLLRRAENPLAMRARLLNLLEKLLPAAIAILAGVIITLPWLVRMLLDQARFVNVDVNAPTTESAKGYFDYIINLLGPLRSHLLLGLGGAGLLWNLVRRRATDGPRVLALWGLLQLLLALPWGLRFGPFRPDHYAIVLFLPAGLLAADLLLSLAGLPALLRPRRWTQAVSVGLSLLITAGLLGWGLRETRSIVNPVTVLADQADREAIEWVRANTPRSAVFLVNTAFWQFGQYRGVDGGYWLTTLTGRQTNIANAMYTNGEPDYSQRVTLTAERASKLTTCDQEFWALAEETGASYVYVHEGKGSLQPAGLANCQDVLPVYARDGVHIYELVRQP